MDIIYFILVLIIMHWEKLCNIKAYCDYNISKEIERFKIFIQGGANYIITYILIMQYFTAVHSNGGFGIVYLFKEVCHFICDDSLARTNMH